WRLAALFLIVVATLAGGLAGDRLLAVSGSAREGLHAYAALVSAAKERYGGEVAYRDLVFASIQGMLRKLDPHTNFLSPEAYASMREKQQVSFYGLGILVGLRAGRLTVISPIEGTPASRLGIRAGDIIDLIEGEPTSKMSVDEAVSRLKGPKGTEVHITILRAGLPEPLELTVVRDEIPQTTVRYAYMIAPGTGYVAISDFARSTESEVAQALDRLRAEGMERLIVDLRNNGGGLLDQAIEVADQFLPKGSSIVETRGRVRDSRQSFEAAGNHPAFGLPLVVLVNSGTASAAEIVSGAIQDHDMGLLVGTPTWGKGLVQTVYNIAYGAGLALTTAKYYTPSGRLIQRDYHSYYDYYTRADVDGEPGGERPRPRGPEFTTDLGRKVYGGGGITPDIESEPAEVAPYLQFLVARAAFFNFGVEYEAKHPEIAADWKPDDALLDEFARWLVERDIDDEQEVAEGLADPAHREFALRRIRAEVLGSKFGIQASHRVLAEEDAQIRTALESFPRAAELLATRLARGDAPRVAAATPEPH
ncbi:MAG TPA: S41 family peptidase, partial [Thermoanaerobaculia bacterium]|nr:S41 family peptidase [Thermoanaerobaculia bacterium]